MQIADPQTKSGKIVCQIFRHFLRERRDQDPLTLPDCLVDLAEKVLHLAFCRAHLDGRIQQTCRPDELLDNPRALLQLCLSRRGADINPLPDLLVKLFILQRPVVQCRRQAEAIVDQIELPASVTFIHSSDLRQRDMRLINEDDKVIREVIQQDSRTLSGGTACKRTGIVLYSGAVADFLQHLYIVFNTALEPFLLNQLALGLKIVKLVPELVLNADNGTVQSLFRHYELLCRIQSEAVQLIKLLQRERIKHINGDNLIPVKSYADSTLKISRINLYDIASYAESAAA